MKKKLKRIGITLLILAAVCFYGYPLFVAFAGQIFPIPVHQDVEEIQCIELLDASLTEPRVLKSFEGADIDEFMKRLLDMKAGQYVNDPPTEHGPLTVKIYYADGAVDYIGSDLCQYLSASGVEKGRGWYYIGRNAMKELFLEYVDAGVLPDLYK